MIVWSSKMKDEVPESYGEDDCSDEESLFDYGYVCITEYNSSCGVTFYRFYPNTKDNELFFSVIEQLIKKQGWNYVFKVSYYSSDEVYEIMKNQIYVDFTPKYYVYEEYYGEKDIQLAIIYLKDSFNHDDYKKANNRYYSVGRVIYKGGKFEPLE